MESPTVSLNTPNELADDMLRGADQIAEFILESAEAGAKSTTSPSARACPSSGWGPFFAHGRACYSNGFRARKAG
jgi:hypothetical protein